MAFLLPTLTLVVTTMLGCYANHDAKRLYDDLLMHKYNKLIRPVSNVSDILLVKLGLKLSQLIDVDMKNEIITLNVWLIHEWTDQFLRWDPAAYGDVQKLYVPTEKIWWPDVVLYNNADGDYTVTLMTKSTINYNGTVLWEPPAIYRSQCYIDVKYFPFDEQVCDLKFGTWSYGSTLVELQHILFDSYNTDNENVLIDSAINLQDYYSNSEFDVMSVVARKNRVKYPCCPEEYLDITFSITIRRKILFYAVNLIIPIVAINMLTFLAFYLPSDCGEKISLCISILLSLSLFQLLLIETMPPTSLTIPLLGRYIIFTTAVVSLSVLCSVIVLAVHFRSSATHQMPYVTRKLFITVLPRLLFMQKPEHATIRRTRGGSGVDWSGAHCDLSNYDNPYKRKFRPLQMPSLDDSTHDSDMEYRSTFIGYDAAHEGSMLQECEACNYGAKKLPLNAHKALDGVLFIAKHIKDDDRNNRIKDEWKYVAMVVDRLLLYVYIAGCIIGAMVLLLNAPALFDNNKPLPENNRRTEGMEQVVRPVLPN